MGYAAQAQRSHNEILNKGVRVTGLHTSHRKMLRYFVIFRYTPLTYLSTSPLETFVASSSYPAGSPCSIKRNAQVFAYILVSLRSYLIDDKIYNFMSLVHIRTRQYAQRPIMADYSAVSVVSFSISALRAAILSFTLPSLASIEAMILPTSVWSIPRLQRGLSPS